MNIGMYSFKEYIDKVKSFHGHVAPGLIMGGYMVSAAQKELDPDRLYDIICETGSCLPDAVQILTPCTIGNGWLKIMNIGKFALSFYDKHTGEGFRIYLDPKQLEKWSEINTWFLKLKAKHDQDTNLLIQQMEEAGESLFNIQPIKVKLDPVKKQKLGKNKPCPICGEYYPIHYGNVCMGCKDKLPYESPGNSKDLLDKDYFLLNKTPIVEAVGKHLIHDITKVVYKKEKGAAFKKDHLITKDDVDRFKKLGKNYLYLKENNPSVSEYIHENEAALAFANYMCGEGTIFNTDPKEGKVDIKAELDGLFELDIEKLKNFNSHNGVICASIPQYSIVNKGNLLAGTRIIPLYISQKDIQKVLSEIGDTPLMRVLPLRKLKVGLIVTGTEVYEGLVEDKYTDIMRAKVEKYGSQLISSILVPDSIEKISDAVEQLISQGAELIITTSGLSVDPDDVTLEGLLNAGLKDVVYGTPVLPGSMLLIGKIKNVQVIGVPACGLYKDYFSFDLIFPRVLANLNITRDDMANLGNGGLLIDSKN